MDRPAGCHRTAVAVALPACDGSGSSSRCDGRCPAWLIGGDSRCRGLEPAVVLKLLASCDRRTLVGRRNYAVLLLMARLGLRAGEVAAMPARGSRLARRRVARSRERRSARADRYLDADEIKALLAAPDRSTWLGRRDHALLLTAIQTGLRVSELTALRNRDIRLSTGAHARVTGKGRKDRCAMLTPKRSRSCACGAANAQASPTIRCSPRDAEDRSHPRRSHGYWTSTPAPQPPDAPR